MQTRQQHAPESGVGSTEKPGFPSTAAEGTAGQQERKQQQQQMLQDAAIGVGGKGAEHVSQPQVPTFGQRRQRQKLHPNTDPHIELEAGERQQKNRLL